MGEVLRRGDFTTFMLLVGSVKLETGLDLFKGQPRDRLPVLESTVEVDLEKCLECEAPRGVTSPTLTLRLHRAPAACVVIFCTSPLETARSATAIA